MSSIAWLVTAPADYTPQDAREELEQFEESFNNAIENTRYQLERYRGEIEGNNANVPEGKE